MASIEIFTMYLWIKVFTNIKTEKRELTKAAFFCQANSYSSFKTQVTLPNSMQLFLQSSDGIHYLPLFTASALVHGLLYS